MKLKTTYTKKLADTLTPVSIYLKVRDHYPHSFLLESSDYHGEEDAMSIICLNPLASFQVANQEISIQKGNEQNAFTCEGKDVVNELNAFIQSFDIDESGLPSFFKGGVFGYSSFESVQYFDDIKMANDFDQNEVPEMQYHLFQYLIVVDHFKNEMYFITYFNDDFQDETDRLIALLDAPSTHKYRFDTEGEEVSNLTNEEFLEMVKAGQGNCKRGDVFQLVLSRRFQQSFKGDDFNLYRALRSVNPSPYLFYFDFGSFRIFGSSPEAQLKIANNEAVIHPIAGTFRRTGNDQADAQLAEQLKADEKENAEHVMLVDLARNDLSRHGENAKVDVYREVQFFSHVIHLVSKVSAKIKSGNDKLRIFADTFPAGTLSGAPKYRALELISEYEKDRRGIYGGSIGMIGFNGDINQAIIIRSFLSKNGKLFYQAGAGVVEKSNPESELQEVNNKLAALKSAIQMAKEI